MNENKVNLCDTCTKLLPECDGIIMAYGDGPGKDNICCCNGYVARTNNSEKEPS